MKIIDNIKKKIQEWENDKAREQVNCRGCEDFEKVEDTKKSNVREGIIITKVKCVSGAPLKRRKYGGASPIGKCPKKLKKQGVVTPVEIMGPPRF